MQYNTLKYPNRETDEMILRDESELMILGAPFNRAENENEIVESFEACLIGCPGQAHQTGVPDSTRHFCNLHVHRSAHTTLKKWPEGMSAEQIDLVTGMFANKGKD